MKLSLKTLIISMATVTALAACSKPAEKQAAAADTATTTTSTADNAAASMEQVGINITGAGASFPQPIYAKWSADFKAANGGQVNYQSIGSSGGIKQIIAKTVDFGASDAPLSIDELNKEDLIQFPTVIGGVVPVVNIDGIEAGALKLDGETLANIYLGKITTWDDAAIKALNPDLNLPSDKITTVFRSDGSGTTFNFTDYLAKVSSDWQSTVGVDKSIKWPTTSTGAAGKGNEGVASYVGRIKNSIGYVEYAYAKQNGMAHVSLKNAAGEFVQPSADSFAAAGDIEWTKDNGFNQVLTNSATAGAWPIAAATFILVHKNPQNPEQVAGVLKFFDWAYANGDQSAIDLDYVPFSDKAVATFRESWADIKDGSGNAVYQAQ
ncbi:phosphate ABC transporter substrate-binding protein PstS [Moraxella sp. FZLJ2107]|uniref:phosphate ABC transporter substrate-binding protein PstS n=1 Tax=unclassified Moraxella TaxID=2685852 RepID=UPI0020C868BF|nr:MULTISPECIES: phosphate ABC transporter substrate-binding protein PstS [unclassified Moraxella]UTO04602.1 phosphate ABC transporter substrate-binding protein PstS [Moraxella sp. FZLJ2107]UTO21330.1 phosphate ABC transporter substrate-binding protein PstS [Moraxella sp. FZLJ2109]